MNYGQVKDMCRRALNKRNATTAEIEDFIVVAIQRAQRLLRVPSMEKVIEYTVGEGFESLAIPGDYLRLMKIEVNGHVLGKRGDSLVNAAALVNNAYPLYFYEEAGQWFFGPTPAVGVVIKVHYLSQFAELVNDTDSNWLTQIAPDLIRNGFMAEACYHFVDPRADVYEGKFQADIATLNMQAQEDVLINAQISPGFYYDTDI